MNAVGTAGLTRRGRLAVVGLPYAWLLVFFVAPFGIVLKIALSEMGPVHPKDLLVVRDGVWALQLGMDSLVRLVDDALYLQATLRSIGYALATMLLCLVFGYPFAYFMARERRPVQAVLVMAVMLPFWTSFLLRAYAWKGLLSPQGWVHDAITGSGLDAVLFQWGLISAPGQLMHTPFSLVLGMTYTYLPFMVLPLYATLSRMDLGLLEAAQDLGATRWEAFWTITVPLSRAGIVAGSMLVFIPSVGEYVIPELLGGPETLMIGRVIWDEMFFANDWPMAATLAVAMVLLILVPLTWFQRAQLAAREARP